MKNQKTDIDKKLETLGTIVSIIVSIIVSTVVTILYRKLC